MMNKKNALNSISRYIDLRKKEGYEISSIGVSGMKEVSIYYENCLGLFYR